MARQRQIGFSKSISQSERARQFMPFMALKGYYELCRQKERRAAPRHALTEEESLELSKVVAGLHKGDMVRVTYYDVDAYVSRQGVLSEVVPELRFLRLVRQQISFDDILTVEAV